MDSIFLLSCHPSVNQSIIDTGASHHICCSFDQFVSFHKIPAIFVHLPNNSTVQATHEGTINISASLTLYKVLFVPSFKDNLLSVSKLVAPGKFAFVFLNDSCFIQES